jgi:hypothetical protein
MSTDVERDHAVRLALQELIDEVHLESVVRCATPLDPGSPTQEPRTSLLHVRFKEDQPNVAALARFLWGSAVNYALSRRRRNRFQDALRVAPPGDIALVAQIIEAVRNVFIEFRKQHPNRASEVGEVLAYCVTSKHLNAAQVAAKMSLKTASNMPVHGLDGIHACFENDALTVYFLESKLASSATEGANAFANSVSSFTTSERQYLREYELVGDLGNLDTLQGPARERALEYFDILAHPELRRRERYVGVICYTERSCFDDVGRVNDKDYDACEKRFAARYEANLEHHRDAARTHLQKQGAKVDKCIVFFVAVPDVGELRRLFYAAAGLLPLEEDSEAGPETTPQSNSGKNKT